MNIPRFEKRCFIKKFNNYDNLVEYINHERIRKDDILSIHVDYAYSQFINPDNIILMFYKIVEVK